MKKSHSCPDSKLFSPRASLVALAVKLRSLNLFDTIHRRWKYEVRARAEAVLKMEVRKQTLRGQEAFLFS